MTRASIILTQSIACMCAAALVAGCSDEKKQGRFKERAQGYVESGELEKAKIAYMNILRKEPGNTEAILTMGRIWMDQGSPVRAMPYLLKSRDLAPNDAAVRVRLALAYMSLQALPEAHKEAAAALAADPANGEALTLLVESATTPEEKEAARKAADAFPAPEAVEAHLARAKFFVDENDAVRAEEAVTRALAVAPDSVRALAAAGSLRLALKDPEGAAQRFKQASEKAPARSPQRLQYADFLATQGKRDEARALLAEVCRQAPDYIPAWMMAARLAFSAEKPDEALKALDTLFGLDAENYPARLLQAQILVSKEDFAKAIDILEKLDQAHPRQSTVKYQLGRTYLQSGDAEKAAEALREAVALAPNFPEAVFMLAQIDRRSGRTEAAIAALKGLLEKQPKLVQAAVALADAYQESGRMDEAAAMMRQVAAAEPKNVEHALRLGLLLVQSGKTDEARTVVQKVLEVSPGNLTAIAQLVDLDLIARDFAAAEARVREVLDTTPDSAPAYLMRGRILTVQQSWEEAEKALEKALQLDPQLGSAQDLLVQVRRAGGKLPQAIEQAEAALARNPDDAGLLRQTAVLHSESGGYAKAAEHYERLLKIRPTPDAFVLNNLATLYAVYLNQPERAYDLARQARGLRPGVGQAVTPEAKLEAASIADTLGWLMYRRGEYPQALALLQEAAGPLAENAEVQYHLGLAAAAMGQDEAARKALTAAAAATAEFPGQAEARQQLALLGGEAGGATPSAEIAGLLAKSPDDVVLQLRLAEAHEREKNFPQAAAAYAAVLGRNPALVVAARKLAELHAGPVPDPAKALEYARTARQLAPNDPRVAGVLGKLVFESGDHAFAYNLLREAGRAQGAEPAVVADLARAAYSLGKVEEARSAMQSALSAAPDAPFAAEAAAFLALTAPGGGADAAAADRALQQNPRDVPALMVRAAAQAAQKDPASAIASYEAVLAVYPSFVPAQKELALLLAADPGTRDRAFELAGQARKALPDDAEVADVLGRLNHHRKEHRLAVQLLSEAARTRPLGAESLRCLGLAQIALGDQKAGRESLTQALAAGLSGAEAAEVSQILEAESK